MRARLLAFLFSTCILIAGCGGETASNVSVNSNSAPPAKASGNREPVLVELFTSEGCGNCPPADKQLAFLEKQQPIAGADVITLGYHVDYFNDRGWKDEYSSAEYTRRQNLYAMRLGAESIYTPQMIVDGGFQFVGSDAAKANDIITRAANLEKPDVAASVSGKQAEIKITGIGRHSVATAILASAEDELVSEVKAGNNKGKKLPHISVVRNLKAFGKVPEKATEFSGTVELPSNPEWKAENLRYVVYLQEDQSGKIIAVGRVNGGK